MTVQRILSPGKHAMKRACQGEKKTAQRRKGLPARVLRMDYMRYTPRTLTELLDANPMPEIARVRKDGSAVESAE